MTTTSHEHKLVPARVHLIPSIVSRGLRCSFRGPCFPWGENVDTLDQPLQKLGLFLKEGRQMGRRTIGV